MKFNGRRVEFWHYSCRKIVLGILLLSILYDVRLMILSIHIKLNQGVICKLTSFNSTCNNYIQFRKYRQFRVYWYINTLLDMFSGRGTKKVLKQLFWYRWFLSVLNGYTYIKNVNKHGFYSRRMSIKRVKSFWLFATLGEIIFDYNLDNG